MFGWLLFKQRLVMRDFQRRMFVEASIEAVFRVPILPEQYERARRSHKRISY